ATSYVWVRVPHIDASSDTDHIYMDYGDAALADGQSVPATWASTYRGVWHLSQDPNAGGTGDIRDSSGAANHATATAAMTTNDHVTARVGYGIRLDGANNGLTMASMTLPKYTWSMWLRADNAAAT